MVENDLGNDESDTFCRIPLVEGKYFPLLDDIVG
jgi:hypothetical protein